ncbi:MAG: AAA family ATPase [Ferruginibacter sp.]
MSETLIIKNFGPIKDVKLELKKFNILIGENATGKSTILKLFAICRYFSYIMESTLLESYFEQGLDAWGLSEFIKEGSFISYECEHYSFTATRKIEKDNLDNPSESLLEFHYFSTELIALSPRFKNLLNELKQFKFNQGVKKEIFNQQWNIPTSFFQNDVASVLVNPLYIPTERGLQSVFSLGKSSIQNISDSLFNQFAKLDLISRNFKNETIIEPFDIAYKNIDGRGYIRKREDKEFYSLFNGASGYQSTIPVVLVLKYYSLIKNKIKAFLIEEPELNLFPKAQQELITYLVDNMNTIGSMFLLTTHSPYILTAINNLIYAYEIGKRNPIEVKKRISDKYWLNSEDISVYRLLANGEYENIMDEELKQIKVEKIDEISEILSKQWHELADLNFNK